LKQPPISTGRATVASRFRTEIEQAASQGVALDDMTLHLRRVIEREGDRPKAVIRQGSEMLVGLPA